MYQFFDLDLPWSATRGASLPHWFQSGVAHFVTFRTADSLPKPKVEKWQMRRRGWLWRHGIDPGAGDWRERLRELPSKQRTQFHARFTAAFLAGLDRGYGRCALRDPEISAEVESVMRHFDGQRYDLGDWVVMPNHVHVLVSPRAGFEVRAVTASWKRFSATRINERLGTSGRFWQAESFDHLVRHAGQLAAVRKYIAENPRGLSVGTFRYGRRDG